MSLGLSLSVCGLSAICFGSNLVERMSLEEKVGQILMVHFNGEMVNDEAKILLQETKVGGIIYYNWSNGLHSPKQVRTLSSNLQKLAKENRFSIPLLIAVDQEGGVVARLKSGFTIFPGNRALGETGDPQLAKKAALATAKELQDVGINMNLAPVVDVNSNPKNPVIGIRSFGDRPETVTDFGEQFLEGSKQAGIIAVLKHFPGHGDVSVDSHKDLPVILKSKEELEKIELFPFARLASSVDAIMTAHILAPALDPENCSTLSEKTLKYLRENIGFQGVIVSDSLVMGGVLKKCHSVDEAAIKAFQAGCDLLILGGKLMEGKHTVLELKPVDIKRIHSALVEAVKSGRISETKLNESISRILRLKDRYLNSQDRSLESTEDSIKIDTAEHRALAQKIASLALKTVEKKSRQITYVGDKNLFIVATNILQDNLQKTSLFEIGKSREVYFFNGLNASSEEIKVVLQKAKIADILVVCSYNAWKNPSTVNMIDSLLDMEKPFVLLNLSDPFDATLFARADLIFQSFSPTYPSLQAICEAFQKRHFNND